MTPPFVLDWTGERYPHERQSARGVQRRRVTEVARMEITLNPAGTEKGRIVSGLSDDDLLNVLAKQVWPSRARLSTRAL